MISSDPWTNIIFRVDGTIISPIVLPSCVADPLLGVAREEFVKSIRQFLKVESEMFPVFIITNPGSE